MSKIDLDKTSIEKLLEEYVNTKYQEELKEYKAILKKNKIAALQSVTAKTFVHNSLMWQDTPDTQKKVLNRLEFKIYCRKLTLAQREDWRVPTYEELLSLVDYTKFNPASLDKIQYISPLKYWSSTQSILEKRKNWLIDFKSGTTDTASELERYHIRCVREISPLMGVY